MFLFGLCFFLHKYNLQHQTSMLRCSEHSAAYKDQIIKQNNLKGVTVQIYFVWARNIGSPFSFLPFQRADANWGQNWANRFDIFTVERGLKATFWTI